MQQGQDIYFQGKIYQGCDPGESRYNYPSVESAGSHTFVDGQSVVLGTDYKLAKNCIDPECTEPELTDIHSTCCNTVAIPLTVAHKDNSEARDKAKVLVDMFRSCLRASSEVREIQQAKQCARLHCDEMIKQFGDEYNKKVETYNNNCGLIIKDCLLGKNAPETLNTIKDIMEYADYLQRLFKEAAGSPLQAEGAIREGLNAETL